MEELIHLLKLNQKDLKKELFKYLKDIDMNPISQDGFLYAEGDIPVMLVAHMDTVLDKPPEKISYSSYNDILFNQTGGLGGDDRCGIYAILYLLRKFKPYVLFTEDEEIGCVGANKAVKALLKPNVKYIIELDRRGFNDCVFYDCGNYDFIDYIESFGFKMDYGSYSDIAILGPSWDIATVNLSCGYYNEHTSDEYIIVNDLMCTIKRVKKMLKSVKRNDIPYYDYQKDNHKYNSYDFFDFSQYDWKKILKYKKDNDGGKNENK